MSSKAKRLDSLSDLSGLKNGISNMIEKFDKPEYGVTTDQFWIWKKGNDLLNQYNKKEG